MRLGLDFTKIRVHRGAQSGGFEELCCQLAALEDPAEGSTFLRKGSGADQGLECFRSYADGHEVGWQAKYFVNDFDRSQISDLSGSLKRALLAHPKLDTFVVCLPIDLQDNRVGRKLSQLERFERWRDRSIQSAATKGRRLKVELWSASSIAERLGRDSPLYSGRSRYWFDVTTFSSSWFRSKFDVQRNNLGERYTPQSHVQLPIQQSLDALARNPELLMSPREWATGLTFLLDGAARSVSREGLTSTPDLLRAGCEPLERALAAPPASLLTPVPLDVWSALSATATQAIGDALGELRERDAAGNLSSMRSNLLDLYSAVERVRREIASSHWPLTNTQGLVISGPAGIGKSHLLADFGVKQLSLGRPFVLVLTGTLIETAQPWDQIRAQLDLAHISTEELLGALDAAAEAAGCRAVIAVDALNERHGIDLWESRLGGFLADLQRFPRLALVVTVRETYLRYLPLEGLVHIEHPGFGEHAGTAAKAYLDQRGIARPSSPNLAQEFENPLFLRTCCAYLDAAKLKQLPKGLQGITAIFDFYLTAVAEKVERELRLVPQLNIPRNALQAFLEAASAHDYGGSLPLAEAVALLDRFHHSGGTVDQSLLSAFLSEGLLTQEVAWQSQEGGLEQSIRFTFERMSDHLRAQRLIAQMDPVDLAASLRRPPFNDYFGADASWRVAGVVEAMAVQFPENFEDELFDVLPNEATKDATLVKAFLNSLAWRAPKAFSQRTVDWVRRISELDGESAYGRLLCAVTEPGNSFNAEWLHEELWRYAMPERDVVWSIFLAEDDLDNQGAVALLIDWAWDVDASQIEDERVRLAAVTLTWCLSTSHRAVRDRATKALVNLLAPKLNVATQLLDKFAGIDDPYILERLLAACYGAAMQGIDRAGCASLASIVWRHYFGADRTPPLHLLSRDYALGILLYAKAIGQLPTEVEVDAAKVKFVSPWPLEAVSEADLEKYLVNGYRDAIGSSTDDYGDFGNYTLRAWLHEITNLPRALAGQTTQQLYERWQVDFESAASVEQVEALLVLRRASASYRQRSDRGRYSKSGKQEADQLWDAFLRAKEAFRQVMTPEMQAAYSAFAEAHLHEATRMDDDERSPPDVDHRAVRRWICDRAHTLGWNADRFASFDGGKLIDRDRMGNHRVERIGKKYQHIALAEVTARLTDNLAMCASRGQLTSYKYGPEGRDMKRDIDPSLLIRVTQESGWNSTPVTWWTPTSPQLPSGDTEILLAWGSSETGLVNGAEEIDVASLEQHRWLTVHAFRQWKLPGQSRRNHADAWSRVSCVLTRVGSGAKLAKELLSRQRGDFSRLWIEERLQGFIGEHGWRDSRELELLKYPSAGISTPCAGLVDTLTAEGNTEDNSIDETFTLQLPSAAALTLLDLRLRSGKTPEYVDAQATLRWQDPSLHTPGAGAALVSRDYFLQRIRDAGLEPVWIIAGEKNVYGGQFLGSSNTGYGGTLYHTTVFTLDGGNIKKVGLKTNFRRPSPEQLEALRAGK